MFLTRLLRARQPDPEPPVTPNFDAPGLTHHWQLVERHEISSDLADDVPEHEKAAIISDARLAAAEWAAREGVGVTHVEAFKRRLQVGIRFELTVAKAVANPAWDEFEWVWSSRWRDWQRRLGALRRYEKHGRAHPIRALPGGAMVIPLHQRHQHESDPT